MYKKFIASIGFFRWYAISISFFTLVLFLLDLFNIPTKYFHFPTFFYGKTIFFSGSEVLLSLLSFYVFLYFAIVEYKLAQSEMFPVVDAQTNKLGEFGIKNNGKYKILLERIEQKRIFLDFKDMGDYEKKLKEVSFETISKGNIEVRQYQTEFFDQSKTQGLEVEKENFYAVQTSITISNILGQRVQYNVIHGFYVNPERKKQLRLYKGDNEKEIMDDFNKEISQIFSQKMIIKEFDNWVVLSEQITNLKNEKQK